MSGAVRIDARALAELRRDIKRVSPQVRRELDSELRKTARVVAANARGKSVKRTGRFASSWRPSVNRRAGVTIRNAQPYAGQQEYGRQIWLRRGLPYRDNQPGPPAIANNGGRSLPMRQVKLGGNRVQNEARYLIRRSAPGRKAIGEELPRTVARLEAACTSAAERAFS